jgi:ribosomal protein S18 acetylase RimI-like enzyme
MQLHRLVRNPYGRTVYDRLQAAGVTMTWMSEYVRSLDEPRDREPDCSYVVTSCDPSRVAPLGAPVGQLVDGETVIGAFEDGMPLGYLFLSVDAVIDIRPLERELAFEDGYIGRVFVVPEHRQRGVAGALLRCACGRAHKRGASRVTALVARDNVPSRALFESHGFRVNRDHRYVRIGPWSYYSTTDREQSRQ